MHFPYIIISLVFMVLITRPFTVLFHELGHAIPAILLTRQKVTIYLGSYGDLKNSFKLRVGLLEAWFRWSFFWKSGLCVPSAKGMSVNKKIIYVLCGPLASLFIAVVATYIIFSFDLHATLKIFILFFFGSALVDLFNLVPDHREVTLHDGSICYNDGYALKILWQIKHVPEDYKRAIDLYNNQQYNEAAELLESFILQKVRSEEIYRHIISAFLLSKQYDKGLQMSKQFQKKYLLSSDDYAQSGIIKSKMGLEKESLADYNKSLALDPDNHISLNNKGYTFNLLERYKEAISLFDRAIEVDPAFAYSYNNRGLAKIKLGNIEEGLKDIEHSLQLDPANAYAYRNLGIYHLDRNEVTDALQLFDKAQELDSDTHLIDKLITKAKGKLTNT